MEAILLRLLLYSPHLSSRTQHRFTVIQNGNIDTYACKGKQLELKYGCAVDWISVVCSKYLIRLLCFVDRESRYMRVMKPTWCTLYHQFFSVTIPLHVSGLLVVHHQEVTTYTRCYKWYVLYVSVDCRWALRQTTKMFHHTHLIRTRLKHKN
jgi:hypothetical protein